MNYRIETKGAFSVIGQEIEMTSFQNKNVQISTQFWQEFNQNLKKAYLSQSGNWVKYAFMEKRGEKLFYLCAIPRRAVVPENFICKEIMTQTYLVTEHIGSMVRIYDTYNEVYKKILPESGYIPFKKDFLHFERYDERFHWNRTDSVIEIWIPVVSDNSQIG